MRRLIWVVVAVSGLWSGIWFAGSTALERTVRDALAQASPGVAAAGADVAGFPNRFDLTLTDLRVGEEGRAVWRAPFLQTLSLSYKPWHQVLVFPPAQTVTLPDGTVLELTADKLQASLVVTPTASVALDRIVVAGDGLAVRAAGPLALLQTLRFATRQDPSRVDTHEIGLDLTGLRPDPALFAVLPDRPLPTGDASLHVDAFVGFTAPLDRFSGETHPAPVLIEIKEMRFLWGDVVVEGTGRLTPDATGLAEGRMDLTLQGWDSALAVAVAAGAMLPGVAATWAELARRLAGTSSTPDRIDLALVMADGRMTLGPLPLGPAPRLLP